jgi:hypothetical protein
VSKRIALSKDVASRESRRRQALIPEAGQKNYFCLEIFS